MSDQTIGFERITPGLDGMIPVAKAIDRSPIGNNDGKTSLAEVTAFNSSSRPDVAYYRDELAKKDLPLPSGVTRAAILQETLATRKDTTVIGDKFRAAVVKFKTWLLSDLVRRSST